MTEIKNNNSIQPNIAEEINRALSNDRMLVRAFYMIVSTTIIFGAIGGVMGWILAMLVPAYFREVFDVMDSDIWQVGVGSGIIWGLQSGVLTGCSVLLATAWYRSRIKKTLIQKYEASANE